MQRVVDAPYGFSISETHWIGLWDFGWFEVASYSYHHFEPDEGHDSRKLLNSLLSNPVYQISYCVTEGLKPEPIDTHGPFLIKKLGLDDYVPIAHEQFLESIDAHFNDRTFSSPPDAQQLTRVRHLLESLNIEEADYYTLNVRLDDESRRHDAWFVHSMFYEYVVINRIEKRLHICVIAYD